MRFSPTTGFLLAAIGRAAVCDAAGTWTDEATNDGRTYKKYVPDSLDAAAGLVLFFHGAGGSSDVRFAYDVEGWADHFGFLGIVPDGSSGGGGGPGGGGKGGGGPKQRRMRLPPGGGGGSYVWNIEDLNGVNEVEFVKEILAMDSDVAQVTGPQLALGFSNGAGMASLMCCYDSTDLYVAHVGCHVDPLAEFSEACGGGVVTGKGRRLLDSESVLTWNGVGSGDFFLVDGVEGVYDQFANRVCDGAATCGGAACNDGSACPLDSCVENDPLDGNVSPTFSCFDDPDCDEAGQLCLYNNLDHEIDPGMTATAYSYLTSNTVTAYDTGSSAGPGPGPCVDEGDRCGLKDGPFCCAGFSCVKVKGKFECKA